MYKTSIIALKIFVDVMQQLVIVQSIIVERNLHSYYRLPTAALRRGNATDEYFILQCPFKSTLNIPKPKDMDVCMIVGKYNHTAEEDQKPVREMEMKPKTNLHTKVDYRYLKPKKMVKLVKIKKVKPYKMMVKPLKMKDYYKRPKTEIKERYKATNVRVYLDNPKAASQTKSCRRPAHIHDSVALSSSDKPKIVNKSEKLQPSDADFIDDDFSETTLAETEASASLLKYLGVKDVLDKLKWEYTPSANHTIDKSEKFFAESNKHKKGFKTKGYQNMYHRDETYQDHIFYDDLQQMGNYDVYKKSKEKL